MEYVDLVGFMCVHNGAEFIEQSIRSTIPFCNRFIVFEGAWKENLIVNNKARSTDGTIEILNRLKSEYKTLEVYHHNENSQLIQRSKVFEYLKGPNDSWLWLIDHDEVYDELDAQNIRWTCSLSAAECIKINSLTFINDPNHYVPIAWNRLFYIKTGSKYIFYAPNDVAREVYRAFFPLKVEDLQKSIKYFHYSYCHSADRFMEKRKERMHLHGNFKWKLNDKNLVVADGVTPIEYHGFHPALMRGHRIFHD